MTAVASRAVLDTAYADEVLDIGRAEGLDAVGIAPAAPFEGTRRILEQRKAAGLHAGMQFTYRNPARSTDPGAAVRGAQAIVVGARAYLAVPPPAPVGPAGRVARYAWVDHYGPLKAALGAVARRLRSDGWKAVVFADDNSLVDREAAYRAGLGWYGKNANLLLPGAGSWYVLGSVVTDAPLPPAPEPAADGCGPCRRCLDACPTGAIVAAGVVDAGRCLAWLVQQPGEFPRQHRVALGDRLYGCDDCQEVCPPNVRFGRPRPTPAGAQAWVPLLEVLALGDAVLLDRYGRWYLAGRDPRWLRRNALLALGNVGDGADPAVAGALDRYLRHPDEWLRAPAVWAAARLGRHDLLGPLAGDPSLLVRDELAAVAQVQP
jgi:epoxyqueuosine reductase